jgi:chondroitin AC lyase
MRRIKALLALTLALTLGITGLTSTAAIAATPDDDVKTMVSRIEQYYLDQGDDIIIANGIYLARTSEALDYVASQRPDGSWSDVDYADRTSSANGKTWSAYIALYRMLALTQAYRDPDAAGFGDPAVLTAVERALLHWDAVDPGNSNWWETEIGESIAMGRISVLLGDVLSADALAVSLKHNTGKLDPAGANGAWRTTNYLFEAVATRDFAKITSGFATLVQTIAVDDSGTVQEAVQPDASFWAHGAQLYSEGYGMALFTMVAMWADVARGTSLSFTRGQLDTIAFYIIDGTRWMIREEFGMLYLLYRPAKTIDGVTSYASEFLDPLDRMARTDALYASDYRELAANIRGTTPGNGQTGDKYFWRSEFLSHLRDDYGIFTALNSSRTVGSEYRSTLRKDVGNEVVWAKAGATAIQVTNEEYTALGPAFDWFHYPGVTAPYVKETTLGPAGRSSNGGSFTGGVSDGRYSVAVHSLDRVGTQAQKSYFYFDEEMVALGAGIRSTSTAEIHTTVNQVDAAGNASVDGQKVASGTSDKVVADPTWAYNDKVGYVFPTHDAVTVSNTTQTGSYYGEDAVSHDAFTLYLDHGVTPADAGYEYIVLPAATATETEAYAAKPAVTVLRNDTAVQAVRHPGLKRTMATFYRAGSLGLGDGRTLTVSQPSIVMLDESGAAPVVSISNPSQPALLVDVALAGGGADARGTFVLGSGANLGKTVTAVLAADDSAGSPYTASGSATGHGPSLAGDADQATFWRSAGDLPWLQKQLTTGSFATGVEIDWGAEFATRYLVQTSTDGTSWTDQKLVQNGVGGHESVEFPATAANFVRVVMLDGAAPYAVRELAVTASVNLALGAPTTASDGTGPDSATDGNLTTRWIADRTGSPDTSWLQVDLGSMQQIDAVRLSWEASYASKYKIQVSDDGSTWSDVYTTPSAGSDGGTDLVPESATGRYVRMQTVARALSSYGVSLWEFEVFGGDAIVDAPVASGRVNLALGQPTTADSVYNNLTNIVPTMATDGLLTTKWSSNRPAGAAPYTVENWLQVDLGKVQAVSQALVDWESSNSHDYRVEGSIDGSSWTELAHVENTGTGNHRRDVVDFATAHIRYLRVIGTPATKYGLNIWELEVYGGYSLVCSAPVSLEHAGSAVLAATISPADADDTFTATSLSPGIASVVGGPRVTGGQIEFDLTAGAAGTTSVIVTHGNGDEFVSCPVTVAVDKAELQQLVDQANGLDSTRYTDRSWAPLIPALQAAKAALTSADATQADVDAAAAALRAAIGGLAEPGTPTLQVTGTPVVGGKVTVWGLAFDPGTVVTVELHSEPVELGTATVDGTGAFSLTATIPTDTDPGAHEIVVLGGGVELATFALTISPAASDGGPGTTPADDDALAGTGTDPVAMGTGLALALLLLVGGAAAVKLRRRRHMEG